MFNNINDLEKLKSSIINYLITDNYELSMLINNSYISAEYLSSTGWHNEIDIYQLVFSISIRQYKQNKALIENFQQEICEVANIFIPDNIDEKLSYVVIRPIMKHYLNWAAIVKPKKDVLKLIDYIKNIMIAQQVYNSKIHICEDGVVPSDTDSKRMLDAYFQYSLKGTSNERQRKFAKSAVDLANQVTHDRCATRKDAELCYIAVSSVANIVKTLCK